MWPFKKKLKTEYVFDYPLQSRFVKSLKMMHNMQDIFKDTHGNLSWKPFGHDVLIKPSGMSYDEISIHDIPHIILNLNTGKEEENTYQGLYNKNKRKPSVDSIHHLSIYVNNKNIKAICHTHSPYATAFALAGKHIKCFSTEQSDYFGKEIICWQYSDLNNWGKSIAGKTNEHKAFLLHRHGVVTVSEKGPEDAVRLAAAVENCAMKNYFALQINSKLQPMPQKEISKWHDRYQNSYGQKKEQ